MAWIKLIIAGVLEIGWAIGLKYTNGFSRPWPTVATIACMCFSFWLLTEALKTIPIGTCYAVWTGIGATGTALVGMAWLGEPRTPLRVISLSIIVIGIIVLKFASPSPE